MQPARCFSIAGAALLLLMLAGCGGSSSNNSTQVKTTGLKKRVLLTNQQSGSVIILDALKDQFSTGVSTVFGASKMMTAGGITAIVGNGQSNVAVYTNDTESVAQQPTLAGTPDDIAISNDGKTVFAAIHNSGQVDFVGSDGSVNPLSVPSPSRLVLSPNGTKLLVFSDNPNALPAPNTGGFVVIDVASKTASVITDPKLDQPYSAVFNGSETQAFVLNCGLECGGTAAGVVSVDFSVAGSPTLGTVVPVSGATTGLISGSNLFVAGTPPGSANGTLQAVNTSSLTAGTAVAITNGLHTKMRATSNGKIYIAASTCTPVNDPSTGKIHGCLSIFNPATNGVVVPEVSAIRSTFDVTGIQPISNRTVVYVCEGGELDIYDLNTDALTPNQLDVVGKAVDVVQIDP